MDILDILRSTITQYYSLDNDCLFCCILPEIEHPSRGGQAHEVVRHYAMCELVCCRYETRG